MIKSSFFWLGAIAAAIIPLLAIDIATHYLDWQKDVRWELIDVVQNTYSLNREQKAAILDKVFERNQTLTFLIYIKSFAIIVLLALMVYCFSRYRKLQKVRFLKPFLYAVCLAACFVSIKIFLINRVNTNSNIHFLTLKPGESSFKTLYEKDFKGKVLYIDFWGTTCGPCLAEFRDFTQPLKNKFKQRSDINYLYVAQGNEYLWHQQINKYNVEGYHVFVNSDQYDALYKLSTKDSVVLMPHYLIIDKQGNIAEPNAKQPSNGDSLYLQLNKYLADN